jgi:hypothetical protein
MLWPALTVVVGVVTLLVVIFFVKHHADTGLSNRSAPETGAPRSKSVAGLSSSTSVLPGIRSRAGRDARYRLRRRGKQCLLTAVSVRNNPTPFNPGSDPPLRESRLLLLQTAWWDIPA